MWYYARTICVLLLGLAFYASVDAQQLRIGYVDMKAVLDSAPQVIAGRAKLDREFRSRNDAIEMDELRGDSLEMRLQQGDMTADSRLQMERDRIVNPAGNALRLKLLLHVGPVLDVIDHV